MYYIVLYDLANGLKELKSVPLENEPTEKEVLDAVRLYGAKSHKVITESREAQTC